MDIYPVDNTKDPTRVLMSILGIEQGDEVHITTPQFERLDGRIVWYTPLTLSELKGMRNAPDWVLWELGLQVWEKTSEYTHWLYPADWYDYLPDGLDILTVNNTEKVFKHGETSSDRRCGALGYGFIKRGV